MKKIRQVKKVAIPKLILGFVLLCIGINGAIFNNFFILVISGIGVFLMLTEGSEIDLESKNYREIYSILGIDFGKWKKLPDLEYVSVFKTRENTRVQSLGASANLSNQVYKLNLFYDSNKKIEAYKTVDINDAFEIAKHLSESLNIDILDATERESKWL